MHIFRTFRRSSFATAAQVTTLALLLASCGQDELVTGTGTGDATVGDDGILDAGGTLDSGGNLDSGGGKDGTTSQDGTTVPDGTTVEDVWILDAEDVDTDTTGDDADTGSTGDDTDGTATGDDTDGTATGDDADGTATGDDADGTSIGDDTDGTSIGDDTDGTSIGDDAETTGGCPGAAGCGCATDADCDAPLFCEGEGAAAVCTKPCEKTTPPDEVCDGLDNDCDGETDEATCAGGACATSVCAQGKDGTYACEMTPAADGGSCDDGNACSEGDTCKGGLCIGTAKVCDDGNPCTDDSCDKANGCDTKPASGACDDGNACTEGDACKDGSCIGSAKVCDDNNPCTTDGCDLSGACTVSMNDGAACDDGDACTKGDSCQSGVCAAGKNACDDGDACTTDACKDGGCTHAKLTCNDENPCTVDACDMATGCTVTAVAGNPSCDDGDACTEGDACFGGGCAGKAKSCDDNDPCTTDACDAKTGCSHAPADGAAACDDGDACTEGETCTGGKCGGGTAKACDDGNPCTTDACKNGACDYANTADGGSCDDGDACTEGDVCTGGICKGPSNTGCDDGNACTDDACTSDAGCSHTANEGSCDDGNACTEGDACAEKVCKGKVKTDAVCDDNNACTTDACDPKIGCASKVNAGASCEDGESCTVKDTCNTDGKCVGGSNVCECQQNADCKDDSDACNGSPICKDNKCVTDPATVVVCDPSGDTACLAATCDPKTGDCAASAVNEGKACADGNPCTTGNTCQKGTCADGAKAKCDDGDACTTDACDAKAGECSTTAIDGCVSCIDASACDDKDPCTKDACKLGICQHDAIAGCSKGPQLTMTKVVLGAAKVEAGGVLDVSYTLTNAGLDAAGPFKVAILLSEDPTADKDDAVVDAGELTGLQSKQVTTQKRTIKVPSTLGGGTWYVIVVADQEGVIVEDNEADNSASATVAVTPMPDLVVQAWTTDKDFYGPGTYVTLTATVANIGGAKAPANSVLRAYISADGKLDGATYAGQWGVAALAAGASSKINSYFKVPALKDGTYTLFLVADFTKTVAEGDETNNAVSKKIQIGAVANLKPTALDAKGAVAGSVIDVSYSVINDNNKAVTSAKRKDLLVLSKNGTYSADDIVVKTYDRGELGAGKTEAYKEQITLPKNLTTGTWYLVIVVDSAGDVPEVSENDNQRYRGISVTGLPDLIPTLPTQAAIQPGANRSVTLRVDNKGFGTAVNSSARIYLSQDNKVDAGDTIVSTPTIYTMSINGYRTVNVTFKAPTKPGTWYLIAVADYNGKLAEYDETNNTTAVPFKVLDKSDLLPTTGKLSSAKVGAGEALTVTWTDLNQGDDTPAGFIDSAYLSFDDKVSSSDALLASVTSGVLAAGAKANRSLKVTVPVSTAPGDYKVLIFVDRGLSISEKDENNNTIAIDLTVTAPNLPDLQVAGAEILGPTTSIYVGDDFDVQAFEKNAGLADAGNFQGTWYLSTNTTFDTSDTPLKVVSRPALAAGKTAFGTATLRLPSNTPSATRYLFYVIDSGNAVKESAEGNNVSPAVKLTALPRPDLRLENMAILPNYGTTGTSTKLSFRIRNAGGTTAGTFQMQVLVSTDDNKLDASKDAVLLTVNQSALGANATRNVSYTFKMSTVPAGKQVWVGAIVDSANKITEANEGNNALAVGFSTTSTEKKANLMVQNQSSSATTVKVGSSFNASVTYRNTGAVATGGWKARLVFSASASSPKDGVEVGTSTEPSLNAGATVKRTWKVTVPLDLPTTHRYLHVIGDSENSVAETIETDNDAVLPLTVQPLPNLKIVSVTSSDDAPKPNSNVTITVVVANTGAANAQNALFYLRRSTDATITSQDPAWYGQYVSLAPGAQVTITRTFYVSSSYGKTVYVGATIDHNTQITETDETDNVGSVKLMVQ
ncbi:MAG: hypothetical protein H6747_14135 [Deltaproteobacteria bacterium]|nr:hypothetical protein [Deltaproteobacteria bacterium]